MSSRTPVHRSTAVIALLLALVLAASPLVDAGVPSAYEKRRARPLAKGVERFTLARKRPEIAIHVARVARGAPYVLRAVPAAGTIGNGLERTSAICKRVKCLVAVNGDFWKPGTDVPIGGVVSLGRLLRTPSTTHAQVTLSSDGGLLTGPLKIRAALVTDDLHSLEIAAVNRKPKSNELVLFTPAVGRNTRTPKGTVELPVRAIRPKGLVALRKTTLVRTAKYGNTAGNAPIPRDGAVLSGAGRGGRLLRDLLGRIRKGDTRPEALLRIESDPNAVESIGGSPVLVRNGKIVPITARTSFVDNPHPRTLIGWTSKGEFVLVTVDGRQPGHSIGMTLHEAARLMVNLGAVEAVNLDGGGSTTFVERGKVMNRPSDAAVRTFRGVRVVKKAEGALFPVGQVERPVAIALALVRKGTTPAVTPPGVLNDLKVLPAVETPAPNAADPASDPTGSTPEIVYRTASEQAPFRVTALVLLVVAIALAAAWTGYIRATQRFVRQAR